MPDMLIEGYCFTGWTISSIIWYSLAVLYTLGIPLLIIVGLHISVNSEKIENASKPTKEDNIKAFIFCSAIVIFFIVVLFIMSLF